MPPSGPLPPRRRRRIHIASHSAQGVNSRRPEDLQPTAGSTRFDLALTALAFAITVIAACFVAIQVAGEVRGHLTWSHAQWIPAFVAVGFAVFMLIYGGLVYQLARFGFVLRRARHRPQSKDELDAFCTRADVPSVTVLIPSYRESVDSIFQTLMSAALQDYPRKRVVLLVDDPPNPANAEDAELLRAARALPQEIQASMDQVRVSLTSDIADLLKAPFDPTRAARRLSRAYEHAAVWFEDCANAMSERNHTDALFRRIVLQEPAQELRRRGRRIAQADRIEFGEAVLAYRRLMGRFDVDVSSFERKRFVNLSSAPNKAMNLNTYMGLLGRSVRADQRPGGLHCVDAPPLEADLTIPRTDYVLTLDADTLLKEQYVLRLVEVLERQGNERLGLAQSPYSTIPGAQVPVERMAGAATDIMYVWQQGSAWLNSAFWIGANAIIRTSALEDIAVPGEERGFPVTKFIQDNTLIEDTESTVDLIEKGWQIYNYPERLAYSATPPDFGSLIIQRRRWANGGLIILPKLIRYLLRPAQRKLAVLPQAFMRIHYVIAEAAVNTALVVVLAVPVATGVLSWWVVISAAPYFTLYAIDLKRSGYMWSDVFRVYGMNLMLVPVNLAGVFNSVRQALTGKKVPFGRTPKVQGRVVAPAIYIAAECALVALLATAAAASFAQGYLLQGAFATGNAMFVAYAIVVFVGLKDGWSDLRAGTQQKFVAEKRGVRSLAFPHPPQREAAVGEGSRGKASDGG